MNGKSLGRTDGSTDDFSYHGRVLQDFDLFGKKKGWVCKRIANPYTGLRLQLHINPQ